jgi:hypothetical protein
MIAVISSTVYPLMPSETTLYRGAIPPKIRLSQTIDTVNSLVKLDFKQIYIFDNSGFKWDERAEILLKPAKVIKLNSFQFDNKGLSEIYLLLTGLSFLPDNTPILKISGRYILKKSIDESILKNYDFAGKICDNTSSISTRAYYVNNKHTLELVLLSALNHIYSYSHKIVGPRSFIRVVKNAVLPNPNNDNFFDPSMSIEWGMYKALNKNFKLKHFERLFLSGIMAGPSQFTSLIDE